MSEQEGYQESAAKERERISQETEVFRQEVRNYDIQQTCLARLYKAAPDIDHKEWRLHVEMLTGAAKIALLVGEEPLARNMIGEMNWVNDAKKAQIEQETLAWAATTPSHHRDTVEHLDPIIQETIRQKTVDAVTMIEYSKSLTYKDIAELYIKQGQIKQAREALQQARSEAFRIQGFGEDKKKELLRDIAVLYAQTGEGRIALSTIKDIGSDDSDPKVVHALIDVAMALGRHTPQDMQQAISPSVSKRLTENFLSESELVQRGMVRLGLVELQNIPSDALLIERLHAEVNQTGSVKADSLLYIMNRLAPEGRNLETAIDRISLYIKKLADPAERTAFIQGINRMRDNPADLYPRSKETPMQQLERTRRQDRECQLLHALLTAATDLPKDSEERFQILQDVYSVVANRGKNPEEQWLQRYTIPMDFSFEQRQAFVDRLMEEKFWDPNLQFHLRHQGHIGVDPRFKGVKMEERPRIQLDVIGHVVGEIFLNIRDITGAIPNFRNPAIHHNIEQVALTMHPEVLVEDAYNDPADAAYLNVTMYNAAFRLLYQYQYPSLMRTDQVVSGETTEEEKRFSSVHDFLAEVAKEKGII